MKRIQPIKITPRSPFPVSPAPIVPPLDPAKVAALLQIPTPQVVEIASVGWYGAHYWSHYSDGEWDRHFPALAAYNLAPVQARFTSDTWLAEFERTSDLSDTTMTLVFNDFDWNVTSLWWGYGGEGVPVEILQYYPQVDLLISIFDGYMRTPKDSDGFSFPVDISAGFRSSLINIPRRVVYSGCSAIFGGLVNPTTELPWFPTQASINENDCPYSVHLGAPQLVDPTASGFGIMGPGGVPFKDCPRQRPADCIARLGDAKSYLGFDVITGSEVVGTPYNQWLAYIRANETALKIPVRVVYGRQRIQDLILLAYESGSANDDDRAPAGFLTTLWVICEGPIGGVGYATANMFNPNVDGNPGPSYGDSTIRVNDTTVDSGHVNYSGTFGMKRQAKALPGQAGLTAQQLNYSGTAVVNLDYGRGDFRNFQPDSIRASCVVTGIKNIKTYATATSAAVRTYTTNRAWCLFDLLTNKRYGFALDVERFNIQEWIDLAAWCDESVAGFDESGSAIAITRSTFNGVVDSRTAASVLGDFCMTGRLSPPFQDQGKLRVVALREDEAPIGAGIGGFPIAIANHGFEMPALGTGGYTYNPSGAGWTFTGNAGVAHNASPFVGTAPEGTQTGFVQSTGQIAQSLSGFVVGAQYHLKFKTAQRISPPSNQYFDVYIDSTIIATSVHPSSPSTFDEINVAFTASATTHVLKFVGTNLAGGDNTATIDNVEITPTTGAFTGPVFADFDNDIDPLVRQNIVRDNDRSTLTYSIKADSELANEIKISFNDANYEDTERPLILQDLNRQMLTGRAAGDLSLRVVSKSYAAYGINNMSEAARLGTMLLYYGENDSGGVQNNFTIKFTTWSALAKMFGLHPYQVIRVLSQRINRFTERGTLEWEPYAADSFQYFRVTKLHRTSRMLLEVEAQLYARSSLQQFAAIKTSGGSQNTDGQTTTDSKDVQSTTADSSFASPAKGGLLQIKQSQS